MRLSNDNEKFDTCLTASDWRYSAAIVGLCKYFKYYKHELGYELSDDYLKFNAADITEDRYLKFAESYFEDQFQHRELEKYMNLESWSEDQTKRINELLRGNSVMKKVFGKIKFDGENAEEIRELIQINRSELIRETFRNKSNLYKNFANPGQLFKERGICCRLWGYYVDGGRKTKALSYNFDVNTFVSQDDPFFDFIPFAFWGDREVFFVNDNFSLEQLICTNETLEKQVQMQVTEEQKSKSARKVLFKTIQETADFLNYSVEVITKQRDAEFFETMYVRKESIKVLRKLNVYEPFCFFVKINDNYYLDVQKKVTECILNLVRTDELIEFFLKRDMRRDIQSDSEYLVSLLIRVNSLVCGGGEMNQAMRGAYACAKAVVSAIPENKHKAYRQKLTSAVVFKDYDRCCQILLQLSNYSGVTFDFVYDLFEDFEKNKDVIYTFINALTSKKEEIKQEG